MRGKVTAAEEFQPYGRITPAYAGKRQSFWHTWTTDQDHPRLCGEKTRGISVILDGVGSPPPMRGKD